MRIASKSAGEARTFLQKARVVHTDAILPPSVTDEDLEKIDFSKPFTPPFPSPPPTSGWPF